VTTHWLAATVINHKVEGFVNAAAVELSRDLRINYIRRLKKNVIGIGHAHFARSRLKKMSPEATRLNAQAPTIPSLAAIPVHLRPIG
jgi:hypothetical protein